MLELQLTVHEIDSPSEIEKGIAKIHLEMMESLSLKRGDVIYLKTANKKTFCHVAQLAADEKNKDIIRIDHVTRINSGGKLGSGVTIGKADNITAKGKIELTPYQSLIIADQQTLLLELLNERVLYQGDIIRLKLLYNLLQFKVEITTPPGVPFVVGKGIEFKILPFQEKNAKQLMDVSFEDIGGLQAEIAKIKEIVQLPMQHPEIFRYLGVQPPKGILLYGPPGTGKTLIAKAIAKETNSAFFLIKGPEIMSQMFGQSEKNLRDIFDAAKANVPSIILIDEIDSIAPNRDHQTGEIANRVVTQLLSLLDGIDERGQVIVVGTTNRPNALDMALRRGGRFDREVEIGVPDQEGRLEILQIHTRWIPLEKDVNLREIAKVTHGFVGSDLASLVKEAAFVGLRRLLPGVNLQEAIPYKKLSELKLVHQDFVDALKDLQPSVLREFSLDVPKASWDDIGGLEREKQMLKEIFEWPVKYPGACKKLGIQTPRGILLHGPSGCGKTLLARVIANEVKINFLSVKGPELLSKWVGESERGVRELFKKARQVAPCMIFFDEIDSLAPAKQSSEDVSNVTTRVVSQLLTEIDGLQEAKGIILLAATNRLDMVEPALLRPGRFDILLEIGFPDENTRRKIFDLYNKGRPLSPDIDVDMLIDHTQNKSGAYIKALCSEASK
nr:AAA family ATPase [Candidatus Sigynarchaeota archaeon]